MKKVILFFLLSITLSSISAVNPYTERWKKIESLADKQLPESAMKEVESIMKDAQKDKKFPETVKAYIYKMRFTLEKNADDAQNVIKDFESFASTYNNVEEKSLLHSMTAELYSMYYLGEQYTINQRTQIEGYIPDNTNEWSKNIFFKKISDEITLSLSDFNILQKSDVSKFEVLLEKGKDSEQYQPTLYDFLAQRAINILQSIDNTAPIKNPLNNPNYFSPINEFISILVEENYSESVENHIVRLYQDILSFRQKQNNIPALVFIDMSRLEYILQSTENVDADSLYLEALLHLEAQYTNNEVVVDVLEEIANFYLTQFYVNEKETPYKRLAYETAEKGIKKFPKAKRINALKNIQVAITQKNVNINYPVVAKPQSELIIQTNSSNISQLEVKIYKVNATAKEYHLFTLNRKQDRTEYPNRKLVHSQNITIKADENFEPVNNEIKIKTDEYGIYEFTVSEKGSAKKTEQAKGTFTVTDFTYIQRQISEKEGNFYVVDRINGNTIDNVNVSVSFPKWNGENYSLADKNNYKTDKNGAFSSSAKNYTNYIYFFEKGDDKYFSSQSSSYYWNNTNVEEKNQLTLFTDRSLYRPNQTVYFKGIAYSTQKQEVIKNADYEIKLLDANWQEISKKTFRTNEFGSFSGEFILPEGGLNGAYQLRSNNNFSVSFYVEEYKRPTFEVKIERPEDEVNFGQKTTFKGNVKAYAGYNIPEAQIKYTITKRTHLFYWWVNTPEKIIANGTTISDGEGNFEVSFIPEKTKERSSVFRDQFFTYTIQTEVTDTKGETQQGVQTISVGDKSLFIVAKTSGMYERKKDISFNIRTETLNGKIIPSTITYSVYKLRDTDTYYEKLENVLSLKENGQVLSGKFNTEEKELKLNLSNEVSGYYKIVFTTTDTQGREVKTENAFILYDNGDKQPPVKSYVWMLTPKTEVSVGENAEFHFGTSTENTSVLYELMKGNEVLESSWITFNNEVRKFEIPFKSDYADGVNVIFTFIKDEQLFTRSVQLKKKIEEKKLTPTLSVFRNKLQPGEEAEWTVAIPETADGKMLAELMISMYDASLNAIRPHNWVFNPSYRFSIPHSPRWSANGLNQGYGYGFYEVETNEVKDIYLSRINWFGLRLSRYYNIRPTMLRSASIMESEVLTVDASEIGVVREEVAPPPPPLKSTIQFTAPEVVSEEKIDALSKQNEIGSIMQEDALVQVRTNFNETAFFYPQLKTDANGNIKFSFKIPESLTRWNMKMLAHTPDLYFGQSEEQVVTQKDLMIQLNMPRFVRNSDKLTLVANVINLTENTLATKVNLEIIEPKTNTIIKIENNSKEITLEANETKSVEWNVTEFSGYELVIVKVTAHAGTFSDGEQHYLPVLPDKVLITESMLLTIRGNETRKFTFDSFINQAKQVDSKNLIVEFSSNPNWYAVQALPTLSTPENENAIDYFTAFYANGLAAHIANSNPKIATIFDRWKAEGGSREALLSNLEKNTELKNILLEETPWVMNAKDETEQKRQIALLFDLNQQKNQGQQYMDKLLQLQKPSGGFAWFDGMSESRYITQTILLNMARYNTMTNAKKQTPEWIKKALNYIDLEITRDFDNLKKNVKDHQSKMVIGDIQLFYLHVRSFYKNIPLSESAQAASKFYTSQAEKYWTECTLYGKAVTALVAYRNGKTTLPIEILNSLKENAMKTDELGMYWARNTAGYFWNERPIAVQTAIMEAFSEITKNQVDIDEMKIWLLKQKQTQRWDSPISTVDAIYALLNYGTDWLANEGNVEIKLGNKKIEPQDKEAGTGYFKRSIEKENITPKMGNVTVKKSDTGIGWGSLYWQYFQDVDKVQQQGGALSVTKKLFVEKTVNNKTSMIPVEQTSIKKGDKIITRLVVSTDRNLEFVALKDLRAAGLEPVNQRSRMIWREGISYYETTKDASTQFFFNFLPTGTYVFEYECWANNSGDFSSGMTTIQCLYAPEFISHSSGERIGIK